MEAGSSGSAVSVAPPEQAETNMVRIRNPAALRFMVGVCHGSRGALLAELSRPPHAPFQDWRNLGDGPTVPIRAFGRPLPKAETTKRPEISGSRQSFVWWSWGESTHRNLSGESVWTASARGFRPVCPSGMPVSVWWCAFCAMKCATRRAVQKGLFEDHSGGFQIELLRPDRAGRCLETIGWF